jgi:Phospholipase_D-nuclease N-terminal
MGLGLPELFVILLVAIVGIGGTGFWIVMLIECATKEADTGNTKVVWIIILVFTHIIGALLYFFVRRPDRMRELGR